jgi:hypothetical protein
MALPGRRYCTVSIEGEVPQRWTGDRVYVFDTTLRDGEQSPGFALDGEAKLLFAKQLEQLGVDVIEAGFPISSPGDFEACREISREVRGPMITALARAVKTDIDAVWGAIRDAERPQIHIVLSVSAFAPRSSTRRRTLGGRIGTTWWRPSRPCSTPVPPPSTSPTPRATACPRSSES